MTVTDTELDKRQELLDRLRLGEVIVSFDKVDGTRRIMRCTLNEFLIPQEKIPKGTSIKKDTFDVRPVFDLDKSEWRSFRFDSIISYS